MSTRRTIIAAALGLLIAIALGARPAAATFAHGQPPAHNNGTNGEWGASSG